MQGVDDGENEARMARGELYYAFTPRLIAERTRCREAWKRFNAATDVSRRQAVAMFRDIINDKTPLPPLAPTQEEDDALFDDDPWVESPIRVDYGKLKFGKNVYINVNSTFIDTCEISIGARTLVGPNCSFYSGTHPLDPFLRNGTQGPELGKPISIGEDCWLGGNVIILPGVTLGQGVTVGAGSVVTKDVPAFHCVAGNPARILKKIEVGASQQAALATQGAEVPMAEEVDKIELADRTE